MNDIVLLHGTTAGQASYAPFAAALSNRGWTVHGVDLPVDRPEWRADEHAAFLAEHLDEVDRPVVLGHSGAGLILEAVGHALDAAHLVWLAAYIPADGMSLVDEDLTAVFNADWLGVDPTSDPEAAAFFLYHDCDDETFQWALPRQRLWHPGAAAEVAMHRGEDVRASTVLVASQDRTIRPDWLRRAARDRLGVEPIEVDTGHCPHVSCPDGLAEIVNSAIAGQ
ncbi:alpha/beta hydrolase [Egibacter rhizosphaerae]|uniref:Alpha/beta hydrolase n=1 Tax=Egibacter rhizosphaerae TaxID=1670831 RepID=A0A411YIE0_9ACTN|nr:alpha/beta hydrolase [Egibacter rhizosphaerae]QBI21054.1 alpha/beta hydrolase [Egibacter rhizosphaerae]